MNNIYWRVTYDGIGVYEALKSQIWNDSDFSKDDWESFKNSSGVNWLKTPQVYGNNSYSFFTELGFALFMKNTYPLIIKWLDEGKIKIEKYSFDLRKMNLIYSDEHQIVVEESGEINE